MSEIAVIKTGGKQYVVSPGKKIKVEKLEGEPGKVLEFENLLGKKKVIAKILETKKDKKIRILKFKPKTRYKKTLGHRQILTTLEIEKI